MSDTRDEVLGGVLLDRIVELTTKLRDCERLLEEGKVDAERLHRWWQQEIDNCRKLRAALGRALAELEQIDHPPPEEEWDLVGGRPDCFKQAEEARDA